MMRKILAVVCGSLGVMFVLHALYLPSTFWVFQAVIGIFSGFVGSLLGFPKLWQNEIEWEERIVGNNFPWYCQLLATEKQIVEKIVQWG
jgi:hypothetical protein